MFYIIGNGAKCTEIYRFINSSIIIDENVESFFFEDMLSFIYPEQKARIIAKGNDLIYYNQKDFWDFEKLFCPLEFFKWVVTSYKPKKEIILKYKKILIQLIDKWESEQYILSKFGEKDSYKYQHDYPFERDLINQIKICLGIKTEDIILPESKDEPENDDLVFGFIGCCGEDNFLKIKNIISLMLDKNKPTSCIFGILSTFDLLIADLCIEKNLPFTIITTQIEKNDLESFSCKIKYSSLLSKAKKVEYLSENDIDALNVQKKNKYIIDNCNLLIICGNEFALNNVNNLDIQYANDKKIPLVVLNLTTEKVIQYNL